jgi:hypothetical protein
MAIQVKCPVCGWVDIDKVDIINVEEGPQGEDIVTAVHIDCGTEFKSIAVNRGD